jgi:transposase
VIEVQRDGRREKLPDVEAIAARSRRAAAVARQRPRREQEHQARQRATAFAASVKTEGCSCRQAARRLCVSPRTLSDWCCRERRGEMTCRPRGRSCKQSSFQKRLAVAEFLRDTRPGTGIPAMRVTFPDLPPCELTDLRLEYWQVYRHHNRVALEQLTWNFPGRVWAMDHAKPPKPVDGTYPALFAVRDLASGMELDWLPVPDETAATTRDALLALFVEHGPPLVLKSDNGSAFKADVLTLLHDWQVIPLPSPPRTPRYNGSREAGIGNLKNRTRHQAALAGHAGFWTSDDTEAARRQANEFHYPNGHDQPTPRQVWQSRAPIHHTERERFHLTLQRIRSQMEEVMDPLARESLTAADHAAIHRRVVRQALIELGILSTHWRSITLPIKPRKYARIS